MPVRRHEFRFRESHRLEITAKHFRHFEHTVVLRRDRTLPKPALDCGDMVSLVRVDVVVNALVVAGIGLDHGKVVGGIGGECERGSGRRISLRCRRRCLRLAGGKDECSDQ
jgi:hypothetical protein